jgi:hypothetical protein
MNVDTNIVEMVGLVEIEPHMGQTRNRLDITFSSKYMIRNIVDGPLYISN